MICCFKQPFFRTTLKFMPSFLRSSRHCSRAGDIFSAAETYRMSRSAPTLLQVFIAYLNVFLSRWVSFIARRTRLSYLSISLAVSNSPSSAKDIADIRFSTFFFRSTMVPIPYQITFLRRELTFLRSSLPRCCHASDPWVFPS